MKTRMTVKLLHLKKIVSLKRKLSRLNKCSLKNAIAISAKISLRVNLLPISSTKVSSFCFVFTFFGAQLPTFGANFESFLIFQSATVLAPTLSFIFLALIFKFSARKSLKRKHRLSGDLQSQNRLRKAKSMGNNANLPLKSRDDFRLWQNRPKIQLYNSTESGISNLGFEATEEESSTEHII